VYGAASYDTSPQLFSALDAIKPADVSLRLSDAVQLLEWAWTDFYPGGTAMTADEVAEVKRRLELWWLQNDAAGGVQRLRVDFTAFEGWFSPCMEDLVRDRANFVRDATRHRDHGDVFHKHRHRRQQRGDEADDGDDAPDVPAAAGAKQLLPLVAAHGGARAAPPNELTDLKNHVDSLLGALEGAHDGGHDEGDEKGDGAHNVGAIATPTRKTLPPLVVAHGGARTPPPDELFDLRNHIDTLMGALQESVKDGHDGTAGSAGLREPR